ncbi:MAG: bifunctional enoyl-CoA hydratase/phosphate acetyltransferase [Alphaproteobacteria bacterium]|nr:bifunctional enoyl-CoA hydratase/phosphate acetyltransferase [Alphaproteobacteria bacterium]
MTPELEAFILSSRPAHPRCIAVAAAGEVSILKSLSRAYELGFATAILCGVAHKIKSVATQHNIDISNFEIIDCADELAAATMAVSLVRDGRADILMKGLIHTADILRAVLNRETGIRGDGILSHVAVMYSPSYKRKLFLTDIAMVMYPDLDKKVGLIRNAVSFARRMGVPVPRVAPLCAVETLNPAMAATVDAVALRDMNAHGEIGDCIVGGPMAFDVAVSQSAAMTKGISDPVAGHADILLFHNIEAGNNTIKAMVQFGDWIFGGVVLGARAPIILNSRSDNSASRLYSIACACAI